MIIKMRLMSTRHSYAFRVNLFGQDYFFAYPYLLPITDKSELFGEWNDKTGKMRFPPPSFSAVGF